MTEYEYKVVNAPRKAGRAKGVRGHDDKYAYTLSALMNEMAADGWNYFRAESLPVDEKAGIMGKISEKYLSLLVFQRRIANSVEAATEVVIPEAMVNVPSFLSDPVMNTPVEPELIRNSIPMTQAEAEETVPTLGPAIRD